ncbi:TAP42-like protein [Limtongia smithiae]|uniref:TAP42-like protein n=1 Tax=Limtongia smithiae TaxID=1125753 RepID=UPI0034D0038C
MTTPAAGSVVPDRTLRQELTHALFLYAQIFGDSIEASLAPSTAPLTPPGPPPSEAYQAVLKTCIASFTACKQKSDHLALFSDNETVEDVATSDLVYLMLDYYLATLTDRIYAATTAARAPLAVQSKKLYIAFLVLTDSYALLEAGAAKVLHGVLAAGPVETPSYKGAFAARYSDPGAQRQAKIVQFRAQRETERQVQELQARRQAAAKKDGATAEEINETEDDDDIARELYLKLIALFVSRSFDALQGLDAELEMLAFAARQPALPEGPSPTRSPTKEDGYSERVDTPARSSQPLLNPQGKVMRPFMLVSAGQSSTREQVRQGVFRPDYVLPTMSVDEYLEEERRRGNIISGGGPQSAEKAEPADEDNNAVSDRETYRLRQWDEFTEANPRGSGNTKMNRG